MYCKDWQVTGTAEKENLLTLNFTKCYQLLTSYMHSNISAIPRNTAGNNFLKVLLLLLHCFHCLEVIQQLCDK